MVAIDNPWLQIIEVNLTKDAKPYFDVPRYGYGNHTTHERNSWMMRNIEKANWTW